jgi:histidinol phosphatase-like PHP family hydrolase
MIDFHTHTVFSDGELIPSELVKRAKDKGYRAIAITDHVDFSNLEMILNNIKKVTYGLEKYYGLYVFCGVEITHVPPQLIKNTILSARQLGAEIVVVHGESPVENVAKSTNMYAIASFCDILAHPGLIGQHEVELAVKNNVYLEITARSGHSLTNGHVFQMSKKYNAKCVINTDTHSPYDLIDINFAKTIIYGCGMNENEVNEAFYNSEVLLEKILKRRFTCSKK